VYDETAGPIVNASLEGFNGTIFAYGQTGTGKTFTMEGVPSNKELRGIIPNAFEHIFDHIALSKDAVSVNNTSQLITNIRLLTCMLNHTTISNILFVHLIWKFIMKMFEIFFRKRRKIIFN